MFKVIIPARYASTRFPGKVLADIAGKPMLQHVYERALRSGADEVLIATDDARVVEAARAFAAPVCLTSGEHRSGSERLSEVVQMKNWPDEQIVVNVQADEPQIPPQIIQQVAENLAAQPQATIATLCVPLEDPRDIKDPNIVKVVFDKARFALYFSRATIPFSGHGQEDMFIHYYRHIGLYAYRAAYLKHYRELSLAPLEQAENLEQLRALWHGEKIHVDIAKADPGVGVDTSADLKKIK